MTRWSLSFHHARLSEQKGILHLIEATSEILHFVPGAYILLVGDGPSRAELEQQAKQQGVAARVCFGGRQDDLRPGSAQWMSSFCRLNSRGCPSLILEAMAAGLPVVATAVNGTPEAVEDGVTVGPFHRRIPPPSRRL